MAEAIEVADVEAAIELFHARGWTDGLPVIPPTAERVADFLATVGRDGDEEIGFYEVRQRPATYEKVAINAIMAGCRPEHFPVVTALVDALLAPENQIHIANSSTGSLALGFIVNGPVRHALKMNSQGNMLGPGNRANASIGRALRLVQINVMGSIGGAGAEHSHGLPVLDRSTIGHPAKYAAYHVVENEEAFPALKPAHVELGFAPEDSVVTAFAVGNHLMLSSHFEKTPDEYIDTLAHYLVGAGRLSWSGFGVLLLPLEAAAMFVAAGWSKRDIAEALFARTSRSTAWVKRNGWKIGGRFERGGAVAAGDEETLLNVATTANDIHVVVCGGPAGNFPTFLQTYGPTNEIVSRKVDMAAVARGLGTAPAATAVADALAGLSGLLRTDGYELELLGADTAGVRLQIKAGPDACADCLVPPAMMTGYVRDALKGLPAWREAAIDLRYPAQVEA